MLISRYIGYIWLCNKLLQGYQLKTENIYFLLQNLWGRISWVIPAHVFSQVCGWMLAETVII